ncbi:MAG TPA: glycosyltransferase family 4 protein [Geobacteraceae bacterium]|nr:glycosyltransferase family 4 protein [Geobacteraceae bacterium]
MVTWAFPPNFGGATVQATYLATELKKRGTVDVAFITDNRNRKSGHDIYGGVEVFHCSTFFSGGHLDEFIFAVRVFIYVLFNRRFQVIHFHSIRGLEALIFPLLRLLGKRVVLKLTLIGVDDPMAFRKRKKLGFLYSWGLAFVNRYVAISSRLRELALEAGVPEKKVVKIHNGVDTARFSEMSCQERSALKESLGITALKVFLSIGKVEERKGYDFLLRAWLDIRKSIRDCVLLIIGPANDESNPYYLSLHRFISDNCLDNVFFLGKIDRVEEYVKVSDCFLFCSRAEGFGTVVIEAMSSGVPVVALNIPGVTEEIIREEAVSRICYSDAPEEFAGMVVDMMSRPEPVKVREATARVRDQFAISAIARQYEKMYEELGRS